MYYFQYFVSSSDASVFLKTNKKKKLLLSLCFVFTVYKYIGNDLYDTVHYGRAIKEILHFLAAVNKCVSGNFYPLDPYLSLELSVCVRAGARATLNRSVFSETTTWGRQITLFFICCVSHLRDNPVLHVWKGQWGGAKTCRGRDAASAPFVTSQRADFQHHLTPSQK